MKHIYKNSLLFSISILLTTSCDFLDIESPKTQIVSENAFEDAPTANAVILGIYARMFNTGGFTSEMTRSNSLAADELIGISADVDFEFYNNDLTPSSASVNSYWSEIYQYIYSANIIIEALANSNLDETTRQNIEGEARFIRAFCYFYLVNLWGDVPLILGSDYIANAAASRNPESEIYNLIITDLTSAASSLPADYSFAGGEKLRPNKYAAKALLARVYLYMHDWDNAALQASSVIENTTLYNLEGDINNTFLANSSEAIWQIRTGQESGVNTFDAEIFILNFVPTMALSEGFVGSFENGDLRRSEWIKDYSEDGNTFYYPYKYKVKAEGTLPPVTEYLMVLRLSEMFLVRAEALAQKGNLSESITDVDQIRARAGLALIADTHPAITKEELLTAVLQERKSELFTEWGHRWLDLKRMNMADAVLAPIKAGWQTTDELYPIPLTEMEKAPNLLPQNPGY